MKNEDPDPIVYILVERCPKCGGSLYAAWYNRVRDLPVAPVWSVECNSVDCDYVYPKQFVSVEELAKKFEAVD